MFCTLDLNGSLIDFIVREFVNYSDTFNPKGFLPPTDTEGGPTLGLYTGTSILGL
jgi:hypothetical protein